MLFIWSRYIYPICLSQFSIISLRTSRYILSGVLNPISEYDKDM